MKYSRLRSAQAVPPKLGFRRTLLARRRCLALLSQGLGAKVPKCGRKCYASLNHPEHVQSYPWASISGSDNFSGP